MSYTIRQGPYGIGFVVDGALTEEVVRIVNDRRIPELELNYAKGWNGEGLSNLAQLPDLKCLKIISHTIDDISAVNTLRCLRCLLVQTYCKTRIAFDRMPDLEWLGFEWRAGSENVSKCLGLRRLFINHWPYQDGNGLANLEKLEHLSLASAKLLSLRALPTTKLWYLSLQNSRKLVDLGGLTKAAKIEELDLSHCKLVHDLSSVEHLEDLRHLSLNDCATIKSLRPVAGLTELAVLSFYGTTNIEDGDLSMLPPLRKLKTVAFADRKHYNLRYADIRSVQHTYIDRFRVTAVR